MQSCLHGTLHPTPPTPNHQWRLRPCINYCTAMQSCHGTHLHFLPCLSSRRHPYPLFFLSCLFPSFPCLLLTYPLNAALDITGQDNRYRHQHGSHIEHVSFPTAIDGSHTAIPTYQGYPECEEGSERSPVCTIQCSIHRPYLGHIEIQEWVLREVAVSL